MREWREIKGTSRYLLVAANSLYLAIRLSTNELRVNSLEGHCSSKARASRAWHLVVTIASRKAEGNSQLDCAVSRHCGCIGVIAG